MHIKIDFQDTPEKSSGTWSVCGQRVCMCLCVIKKPNWALTIAYISLDFSHNINT